MVVVKRHDDDGVVASDMPTLDRILEACPNLISLRVNGHPPALGLRYNNVMTKMFCDIKTLILQ